MQLSEADEPAVPRSHRLIRELWTLMLSPLDFARIIRARIRHNCSLRLTKVTHSGLSVRLHRIQRGLCSELDAADEPRERD